MAGKTSGTCSPAAPLSRPVDAGRRAKRAFEPAKRPGKHKRSTRATQEEHKRALAYLLACPWLAPRFARACAWLSSLRRVVPKCPRPNDNPQQRCQEVKRQPIAWLVPLVLGLAPEAASWGSRPCNAASVPSHVFIRTVHSPQTPVAIPILLVSTVFNEYDPSHN